MKVPQEHEFRPEFRITRVDSGPGIVELRLEGRITFADAAAFWNKLKSELKAAKHEEVRFELAKVESIDGNAAALLVQLKWDLHEAGTRCTFSGGQGVVSKILELYDSEVRPSPHPKQKPIGTLAQIGQATVDVLLEIQLVLAFLGSMILAVGSVLRRPRTANFSDVAPIMNRTGADAVPIVILINFLVGFVMAFQSAVQLKQFGANILVADLVGLSLTRELGPLMTAIIVCGRSGAAFAAELGTMKVSEEIDALRTMGFGPLQFLIFPRIAALLIVVPILTLLADFIGIIGGMLVGITSLDLTISAYLTETQKALQLWDIFQGVVKSVVFALAIGIISCQQGLATAGGAEGVGRRTTASVVTTLFALILIDAGFTMLFYVLHL